MPLPWKKTRVNRISRFVADLHSPPKRGGSLVVETGFPTSLIDLFVKNRDRLKKSSSKTKKNKRKNRPPIGDSPTPPGDPAQTSSASDVFWGPAASRIQSFSLKEEDEIREVDGGDELIVERGSGVGFVDFGFVFKMFLVAVLTLGTKKLAVGITASAFLLVFLDFLGVCLVPFSNPYPFMEIAFKSVNPRAFFFLPRCEKGVPIVKEPVVQEHSIIVDPGSSGQSSCSDFIGEIETMEGNTVTRTASIEEIQTVNYELEALDYDSRVKFEEIDSKKKLREGDEDRFDREALDHEYKRGNHAKFKARMLKMFVPKMVRSLKKKEKAANVNGDGIESESCSEVPGSVVEETEDKPESIAEPSQGGDMESVASSPKQDERNHERMIGDQISFYDAPTKTGVVHEKTGRREEKGDYTYLIIISIILAGLALGRIVALVLAMGCCFVLKSPRLSPYVL